MLGVFLHSYDRAGEGLEMIERAFRLNPHHRLGTSSLWLGITLPLGNYEQATAPLEECIQRTPDYIWCRVLATMLYVEACDLEAAHAQAQQVLRIDPDFSSRKARRVVALAELREREIALLRQAGWPD